jgi:hypothetical protein
VHFAFESDGVGGLRVNLASGNGWAVHVWLSRRTMILKSLVEHSLSLSEIGAGGVSKRWAVGYSSRRDYCVRRWLSYKLCI